MANFPRIRSTFGVTPYNPERDTDEKRRAIFEHYQDQVSTQPMPDESMPWNVPFPPGVALQEEFDEMLQKRVVDPLSRAGYEDLGAGLASVPSAVHSMLVPQTEFDVAGTIIPLPNVAKAMKKGKFRKIRNAMKAEDPENFAEIIHKKALVPEEYKPTTTVEGPKAEVRAIDEKEMLRKADEANAMEASKLKWEAKRLEEEPIREGIKKKYGLDSENWSTKDSEADPEFGISDVSGKRGNVYEITDGETTLQVLEDEYLDIMGLSGGIGLDETPFYKAMKGGKQKTLETKTPLKSVEPIKTDPPKPPKGDPRLTKEQLGQLKAEIKKIESEIDQLNPSDPDYDFMLDKRKGRLLEIIETIDDSLKSLTRNRSKVVKPSKPPKGDPEASLRGPFQSIRSQLDVAPARMDERGRSFENIGQSDFMPYERPQVGQFEDVQKRNYVERDLDPKEKMWNEIVASDPYLPDSPEYLKNLRNYFDNRWEQAQGTAEGKMMQLDMPMSERWKPRDEKSVTSGYIDELAFKRFAEPYDKTIQSQRPILGPNPRTERIDDKIQRYFGDEIKSPGRKLQDQMYPPKPKEPERFGKIKESLKAEPKGKKRNADAWIGTKKEDIIPMEGDDELIKNLTPRGHFTGGAHLPKGTTIVHDGHMYRVSGHKGDITEVEGIIWDDDLFDDAVTLPDDARGFSFGDDD